MMTTPLKLFGSALMMMAAPALAHPGPHEEATSLATLAETIRHLLFSHPAWTLAALLAIVGVVWLTRKSSHGK